MKTKKLHAPSIVLEWETVEDGGVDRAERGLREVNRQIAEVQHEMKERAEVIICYEESVVSSKELHSILDRAVGPDGWACPVLLLPVPEGTHYYEKKNAGGRASKNSIIVFLDSDLIPDPGWLRNLLRPFDDWSVSVLIGATYLDHATTYEMAMALTWIFHPATRGRGIQQIRRYSSSNLAFRRELFLHFPFPTRPTYRGQCADLAETLVRAGVQIAEHTDARATHPPPPLLRRFVHRAWSAGKDQQFYASLRSETTYGSALRQWWHDNGVVARRIRERRKLLVPSLAAESLGWLAGWAYYCVKGAGYLSQVHQKTPHTRPEQVKPGVTR